MKSALKYLLAFFAALPLLAFTACSDSEPEQRSEYDILGIWADAEDHVLDFVNPERMYEYTLTDEGGYDAWLKGHPMYFFEPYSYLLAMEDFDGVMQMYKVVAVTKSELTLCWVATPLLEGDDDESRFDFLKIFFDKTYTIDPSKCVTYRRITADQLTTLLGNLPVFEY